MSNINLIPGSERSLNTSGRAPSETETLRNYLGMFNNEALSMRALDIAMPISDLLQKDDCGCSNSDYERLSVIEADFDQVPVKQSEEELISKKREPIIETKKKLSQNDLNFCLGAFLLMRSKN